MQSDPWKLVKVGRVKRFTRPFPTLADCLMHWATAEPTHPAVEFLDVDGKRSPWTCTWGQLPLLLAHTESMLRSLGVDRGSSVAFGYENTPEVLALTLAAWMIGARTVPLDTRRDDGTLMRYKITISQAKLLFTDEAHWSSESIQQLRRERIVNILKWTVPGTVSTDKISRVSLKTDALILFTSGTTALPKGVLLTQENLIANADGIADWLHIERTDRFLITLPLHHINSTTMCLAMLLRGGTVVLLSRYTNTGFWKFVQASRATLTSVVPTIIHDQLTQMSGFERLKSTITLTRIQLGSAPVQPLEAEEFVKKTGIPLVQGYGQTETALRSTGVPWNSKHALTPTYWRNLRSNSVGTEMKWTTVTVLRKNGTEAGEKEEGEICVRGPVIMKNYLKDPEATKGAFRFGWFHSGDSGYWKLLDGKKFFYLKSRIKEIIIKAGVNVSPLSVEQKIARALPSIDHAYVIGVPDERAGEEIAAVVVWKHKQPFLPKGIKGLSRFETPSLWFSVSPESLPQTSTGKIQRVKLKQIFSGCAIIAITEAHQFRIIAPEEESLVGEARMIHNKRWHPMKVDQAEWERNLKGKMLIGAIDSVSGRLAGSILAQRSGANVVCVAISTKGKRFTIPDIKTVPTVTTQDVSRYLSTGKDPVIQFHRKPKGRQLKGAEILKIIPNARSDDRASLGYGILMRYPSLPASQIRVTLHATLGTQLVEAAMLLAQRTGAETVDVLTRPATLLRWAIERRKQ